MEHSQNGIAAALGCGAPSSVDTDDATDGGRWSKLRDVLIVVFGSVLVLTFFLYAITRLGTVKEDVIATARFPKYFGNSALGAATWPTS